MFNFFLIVEEEEILWLYVEYLKYTNGDILMIYVQKEKQERICVENWLKVDVEVCYPAKQRTVWT